MGHASCVGGVEGLGHLQPERDGTVHLGADPWRASSASVLPSRSFMTRSDVNRQCRSSGMLVHRPVDRQRFLPGLTKFWRSRVLEGWARSYHARHPRLDRAVAIKILLSPHGASPAQLERFRREARSIARISHDDRCYEAPRGD